MNKNKTLIYVFVLNFILFILELVVGLLSGSLALFADSLHLLSDLLSIFIAWMFNLIGKGSETRTAELTGAILNSIVLFISGIVIFKLSLTNILNAASLVIGWPVMIVAIAGLLVNVLSYALLQKNQNADLNIRGATNHMLADALGSIGAIIASIFILLGFPIADAIIALGISFIIFYLSCKLIFDIIKIIKLGKTSKTDICKKGCYCE